MTAPKTRSHAGAMAYHAGLAAEGRIAQDYTSRGFELVHERWRGKGGEIDLIMRDGDGFIFIEVKQSRSFERAVRRISRTQVRRIYASAQEYLATQPRGNLTDVRFDVALVNGRGETQIIENAYAYA